jgi:hypothetical protein
VGCRIPGAASRRACAGAGRGLGERARGAARRRG